MYYTCMYTLCTQQGRKRELASLGLKQDGTPMAPKANSTTNSSSSSSDKADKKLSRGQRQREKARIKREAAANGTATTADASR
jgi:hypothetical protein